MDININDQKLKEFSDYVKKFRSGLDRKYTHNSQFNPKGKFFIGNGDFRQFYERICELVYNHSDVKIGMMENYNEKMPIIIDNDLDFEIKEEYTNEVLYEDFVITDQIEAYNKSIEEFCEPQDDICYISFVLEKPHGYMKKGYIHNGFHIHYPFCRTDINTQQLILRPYVKKILNEKKTLDRMKYFASLKEKWDRILDDGLPRKTWVMYGCRREEEMLPYKVTAIYDKNLNKITLEEVMERVGWNNINWVKNNLVNETFFHNNPAEYYLPMILSVNAWDFDAPLKQTIQSIIPSNVKNNKFLRQPRLPSNNNNSSDDKVDKEKYKTIKELTNMLSHERADNYNDWIQIGWVLFNITNGNVEGLEIWEEFSRKSPKFAYDPSCCEKQWGTMERGSLTIGTLRFWAKKDNPDAYKEWTKTEDTGLMCKALGVFNHYDVAKFVHKMLTDRYVCASIKHKIWYEFKDHRWRISDCGIGVYSKLSTEVVQRFEKYRTELSQQSETSEDEELKSQISKRIENIGKLIFKLKDVGTKEKIMKELAVMFYNPIFLSKLDDDPDLLCTPSGILDLKLKVLRPGIPEDYCSKCTGVSYHPEYTMETPEVKEVLDYLRKVFPVERLRKYMLRYCSSILRGGNSSKLLPQWYGSKGDNSKSMFTEFFVRALGDYCIKFPSTFLTGKSTANGACTPELERAQGARVGFIQEPDGTINISKAKEYTGGDSVYVRGLYKEGRDMKMMMKWVIIVNTPIKIPTGEVAIHNRMRLIPFDATFCRDHSLVPKTEEEQFELKTFAADPFFQDKIPRLAPAFLWLCFNEIDNFLKEGLCEPQEIIDATNQYKADNDVYSHFIKDKFVDRIGNKLTMAKIYKTFNSWFRINFPAITVPTRIEMRDSLNRVFKRPAHMEIIEHFDIRLDEQEDTNITNAL